MFHEGYLRFQIEERKREVEKQSRNAWRFFEKQDRGKKQGHNPVQQHKKPCCVCICEIEGGMS